MERNKPQIIIIEYPSRSGRQEPQYINSRGEITLKTWNVIKDK
jgi:hypothetical protein